jgi:hypothetical protein
MEYHILQIDLKVLSFFLWFHQIVKILSSFKLNDSLRNIISKGIKCLRKNIF